MKTKRICYVFCLIFLAMLITVTGINAQPLQNNINTKNLTLKTNTSQWLMAAGNVDTKMYVVPVIGSTIAWGNGLELFQNGTIYFHQKVGIGTNNPGSYRLAINGTVRAKEIRVNTNWSDFVFDKEYALPSLSQVEAHILQHKHLPDIPSAAEVEAEGVELGKISSKLLQKIEELTLYVIEQDKRIQALEAEKAAMQQTIKE